VEPWKAEAIEAAVKGYCEKSGLGLGKVAQPIRVAVSGTTISPPIFQSLELLGREATLKRVDRALEL
jgi:glutamyl-tRNA synthetase